jgi:hypothetical protein
MATSNLISKSLGGVLQETGNGSPDHTSPRGSTYVDQSTGILYYNVNGSNTWVDVNKNSYGNMYLNTTTGTTITPVVANTWYVLTGATWSGSVINDGISFSPSTKVLSVNSGKRGKYLVFASGRFIRSVGGNGNFQLGLSVNGSVPSDGFYQGSSVGGSEQNSSVSVIGEINLIDGDTVQLTGRNIQNTNPLTIGQSSLTLIKLGNT